MLLKHTSGLAVRAALFLALQPPGKLSTVQEIAAGTGLPKSYLAKILQRLAYAGMVRSFRGPGGGIELGRAPEEISLWGLVQAMDGPAQEEDCILGSEYCSRENPCPLHVNWARLKSEMQELLDRVTLATLVKTIREREKPSKTAARETLALQGDISGEGDRRHAL